MVGLGDGCGQAPCLVKDVELNERGSNLIKPLRSLITSNLFSLQRLKTALLKLGMTFEALFFFSLI